MCLAVPAWITKISGTGAGRTAQVEIAGTQREVSLALTPDAVVGDYVVTHSGIAVRVLSSAEAADADALIIEALGR